MSTTSVRLAASQPCVLAEAPPLARSLVFRMLPKRDWLAVFDAFARWFDPGWGVVGIGEPLARAGTSAITGLRTFPAICGPGIAVPSMQGALWVMLEGEDYTQLYRREGEVRAKLRDAFAIDDAATAFRYDTGRDLSGFEDGTANPTGEDAVEAAIVADGPLAGSSFAAVQRWIHDLQRFAAFPPADADDIIGRRLETNEEFEEAPPSAHVKRTAQEAFEPEAFVVRRSMPWSDGEEHGLVFVAFGNTLDKYEAQLRRMAGLDDGIIDGLFTFSRPLNGGYYWVPPVRDGRIDPSALAG